jgi:hypothetical protein
VCYNHRRTNLKESLSRKERSRTRTLQSTTDERCRFLLTHKQQTRNPTTHRRLKGGRFEGCKEEARDLKEKKQDEVIG